LSSPLSQPGRFTESLAELRAIMNAVKARDADAVANACLYHISRAGQAGIDALPQPPTGAYPSPSDERPSGVTPEPSGMAGTRSEALALDFDFVFDFRF